MRMKRFNTALVVLGVLAPVLPALPASGQLDSGPWPMFHRNPRHTGWCPYIGPTTPNLAWSYTTGGAVDTPPAVDADGTVYIGSQDSKIYALNSNGSLKWSCYLGDYVEVYSGPAVDREGVVYVSASRRLYVISPDGTLSWSYTADNNFIYSSPAIGDDNTIYVGCCNNKLFAFNPDGSLKWSYTTGGWVQSSPACGLDGMIYVGSQDKKLYALYSDGTLAWSYETGDMIVRSSPAVGPDGTIYIGSYDHKLYAIDHDGTLTWSYPAGYAVDSSPAIGADGTVYVGSVDDRLYAIDPNGSLKWDFNARGDVNTAPAVGGDGTVYFGDSYGKIYAVDDEGSLTWSYQTGFGILSSPAIGADGTVYVGSADARLYAFGPGAGPIITVTLTPDATTVERGGQLGYTVEVTNNTADAQTTEYWSDVYLWTGAPYKKNPVFGPKGGKLPGGYSKALHISHKVPNSAPLRTYTLCGRIGSHPYDIWGEDCFEFTVVEAGCEAKLQQNKPPILILINDEPGYFGRYTGEILRAEGISEFQITSVGSVTAGYLDTFDVVILNATPLESHQVAILEDYVSGGGRLIVFKPDIQLSRMLGITSAGTETCEGYILIDNTTGIGKGIVAETIQIHTCADNYSLNGATEIARLYSDATTPTSYPAITGNNYGKGRAIAFAYDFPKSIAYQRQGNPLWASQERDGIPVVRANDMFYSNEPEVPHWIDPDKTMIPQADEQDKLLVYTIDYVMRHTKPLPRIWYFPSLSKTVVVSRSGDTDWRRTGIYELLDGIETYGGRTTLYLLPYDIITNEESASFKARGHGVGLHVNAGCTPGPRTYEEMEEAYTTQTNAFISYHGFHPRTEINHCGEWVGWVQQARIEENLGFEMDFNYFAWAPTDGGYMTGASQPIKFVDEDGTIINVYQQSYQVEDNLIDWGMRTCKTLTELNIALINNSISQYYTPVVMHIHPVYYVPSNCKMKWANDTWAHAAFAYVNSIGIPIYSSDMWLDFTEMRYDSEIRDITWEDYQLSFVLDIPYGEYTLTVMLPSSFESRRLEEVTRDGEKYGYTLETIDEREYALITTSSGTYNFTATYTLPAIKVERSTTQRR
jgi:outer membrane protein assembly factor BamB